MPAPTHRPRTDHPEPGVRAALHDEPSVWAPRLARVLDDQRALYQQLDGLSRAQAALITAEDTDSLLEVLGRRQVLIDAIAALNEELAPFAERWDDLAPRLDAPQRSRLRAGFDEVSRLVTEIAQRDDADRRLLEARRNAVGSELGAVSHARGAVRAYARPDHAAPRYQDRTG